MEGTRLPRSSTKLPFPEGLLAVNEDVQKLVYLSHICTALL